MAGVDLLPTVFLFMIKLWIPGQMGQSGQGSSFSP